MRDAGVEHVIVTLDNAIRGVLSETDLMRVCRVHPKTPVGELAREVPIIDAESPIADAANVMRANKVGCVPVVENGAIAGVISIEKLLDLIGGGAMHAARRRR